MFCLPTEKELSIVLDEVRKHNMLGMVRDLASLSSDEERAEMLGVTLLVYAEWFKDTGKDETKALLLKFREDVGPKSPYAEGLTLALKVIGAL